MTMQEALRACDLFAPLPEEALARQLLPHCTCRQLGKGSYLLSPQQRLDHIGILCSGHVQILHLYPDGTSCMVDALGAGDVVGLDLLFTHSRLAPYHALAATAASVAYLPVELLLQPGRLEEGSRLLVYGQALAHISQNNMRREYRLAILAQKGLRERIMTYLTMQANRRKTGSFSIPFSREELASFLCVNRSALSHELSRMQQEGILSFRKNRFTLLHWAPPPENR